MCADLEKIGKESTFLIKVDASKANIALWATWQHTEVQQRLCLSVLSIAKAVKHS